MKRQSNGRAALLDRGESIGKLCQQAMRAEANPKYCKKQKRAHSVEAHPPVPTPAVGTEIGSSR
jgi:hypothetical protein